MSGQRLATAQKEEEGAVIHQRTPDRCSSRGRQATCSCGWGTGRGRGWGPVGCADPHRCPELVWTLQEAWRHHAGLPPCAELLPDGYDYWGGES